MRPIKEANRITKIWRSIGPGTYPINLHAVASEIINNSSDGDNLSIQSRSIDSFDGALIVGNNRSWCAVINSNVQNPGRRNFTLAHEIGHFIGHRHLGRDFEDSNSSLHDFENDPVEKEANEFAAQLLMPQDKVRPFTRGAFTAARLDELADLLAVSRQAAGLRWVNTSEKLVGFVVSRDGFVVWGRSSESAFKSYVFFKSGMEIPSLSATALRSGSNSNSATDHAPGVWHESLRCHEDVYFGAEGYTYTCLEYFD